MNFRNAISELCNGHRDVSEIARKHNLSSEQLQALKALSYKVSESSRSLSTSAFVASICA